MRILSQLVIVVLMSSCMATLLVSVGSEAAISPLGYSINGNQELLSDPDRPLVYSADTDGDMVHILNATTMTEVWNITVGTSPMSLDITPDGRYLYVSVSTARCVVVVDLDLRGVSDTIDLTFQPLSVRIGLSGRLYLTDIPGQYESGGPKVVDEASGALLENQSGYGTCVLEMSPDKTVLLMLQLGTSPTPLYKYSCAGATLVLLDTDNHDLGANARQIAVDWTNETIYLAVGSEYGVETVSLATMDWTGFMPADAYPQGVALSPDKKIVFLTTMGACDLLWAFNTTDGTLAAKYVFDCSSLTIDPSTYAAITAPGHAGSVVALGKPVMFLNLSQPVLFPGFPRAGENVGYDFLVQEDGCNLSASLFVGIPECDFISMGMKVDGVEIECTVTYHQLEGHVPFAIPDGGEHLIEATVGWDGGDASISWTFYSSETERVVSVSPEQGAVLNHMPENITVVLDLGYPVRELLSCQVFVNDMTPFYEIDGGVVTIETMDGGSSFVLPGDNMVCLEMRFVYTDYIAQEVSDLDIVLQFTITDVPAAPSLEGLEWHNLSSGASVMLPCEWDIEDNVTEDGVHFDFQAVQPSDATVQSVITLQSGTDPEITSDADFLESFADDFVDGMWTEGVHVDIVDGPDHMIISGYDAVVFSVRWMDLPIVQKLAVMVNQSTDEYWTLIMTVDQSYYFGQDPMFEGVISSFSVSDPESASDDDGSDPGPGIVTVAMILAGAAAAIIAVAAAFWAWNRPRAPPTS